MKTVFKISLFLLFFATAFNASAQKFAIEGGYINPIRYGSKASNTFFYGARIGGTASFDLKNNFSLLTGALYSVVYSNKLQSYSDSTGVKYKTLGHFIDIPLRLTYSLPITKSLKVFGFAGPNLNIGLSQSVETSSTLSNSLNTSYNIETGTADLYKKALLNRLNLQIGVGGGVQWKSYQLKSGYDFGINNLNKKSTGNLYQKGWYVSFAYEF